MKLYTENHRKADRCYKVIIDISCARICIFTEKGHFGRGSLKLQARSHA